MTINIEELTLAELLGMVKGEANRLCAGDPTLSRIEAYGRALAPVFMTAAEEATVTPFERLLLSAMRRLHETNPKVLSFASRIIAAELRRPENGMYVESWPLWKTLSALEASGLVYRPKGPKTRTWALTPAARTAVLPLRVGPPADAGTRTRQALPS